MARGTAIEVGKTWPVADQSGDFGKLPCRVDGWHPPIRCKSGDGAAVGEIPRVARDEEPLHLLPDYQPECFIVTRGRVLGVEQGNAESLRGGAHANRGR